MSAPFHIDEEATLMAKAKDKATDGKHDGEEPRGVPDLTAKKQQESLEDRVAFIEQRLGLIKTIADHEWADSDQVVPPPPVSPGLLYGPSDPDAVAANDAEADRADA